MEMPRKRKDMINYRKQEDVMGARAEWKGTRMDVERMMPSEQQRLQ